MNVLLVSQDKDLYKLCRDILNEFPGCDWHLFGPHAAANAPEIHLYIWDFQPDLDLPSDIGGSLSRHLFLVHRKNVAQFYQILGRTDTSILLKPVTRATLSAFLSLAVAAQQDRISTASRLRADRDEMLQCLIQTNLRLQEYDQDRTNFLARAVHDFRAPLTAMTGYSGLLLSEALGPLSDDQREVLRRMQHSAKRLSRMATGMFELSIERHLKRRPPDLREGDIRECIEQALHEVAPIADGKLISISVDLESDPPLMCFEPGLVEQLLINLLDNACKFTPKMGEITIRGCPFFWERRSVQHLPAQAKDRRREESRRPNAYRIEIHDSGPRIPDDVLDRIFEEYVSHGGHDRSGGGLGLAICRLIAAQHEGVVWADNTDHGPVFSFILPLTTRAATNGVSKSNNNLQHLEVRR